MKKTCETCAFYAQNRPTDCNGECRRYPKNWMIDFANCNDGLLCEMSGWLFPPVDHTDWCGEWRKKEEEEEEHD